MAAALGAATAWASPVLSPGQDALVREAVGGAEGALEGGWRIAGFAIARDRVELRLAGPEGEGLTAVLRGAAGAGGGEQTPLGWLEAPDALPEGAARALLARLRAAPRPLAWREEPAEGARLEAPADAPPPDPVAREAATREVGARWAARRGEAPPPPEAPLEPPVASALDALLAGDAAAARASLEPLVPDALRDEASALAPGALSVWLAAGGDAGLTVHALGERFPDEPRVAALVAASLRADDDLTAAADWVAHGLSAPLDDALLVSEARALGLDVVSPPARALPLPPSPEGHPAWPWQLAGVALALTLLLAALRHRSASALLALLAAGLAAWLALPPPAARPFPELPRALWAPLAGGPCHSGPALRERSALRVRARCPEGPLTLSVAALDPSRPPPPPSLGQRLTAHHRVSLPGLRRPSPPALQSLALLAAAVAAAEASPGGLSLASPAEPPPPSLGRPSFADAPPALRAELRLGAAAVAAALVLALATLARTLATFSRHGRPRDPAEWATLLAFAAAALAHALVPPHMIMVYGGYGLVSDLATGTIPRYGVGALFAYGPLLWLGAADHATLQAANRLLGLACLPLAWQLGCRLVAPPGLARAAAAWLFALLPVIAFDHASESIVVFPTFLALAGLCRLTDPVAARTAGGPASPSATDARALVAAVLLGAAALCRPEILIAAALVPLWLVAAGALPPRQARRVALVTALASLPLLAVQLAQALARSAALQAEGALPGLGSPLAGALAVVLHRNILTRPDFTPPLVGLLVLAGLLYRSPQRRAALATAALAFAWMAATAVDLVDISIPRLHMPALLLLIPVAGLGLAELRARWLTHDPRPASRAAFAALLVVLFTAGAGWSAWRLQRPSNEDAEERFWRDVAAVVQRTGGCVATLDYPDPPVAGKTPRFVPAYLFPEGPDRHPFYPLSELDRALARCPGPVHVALGLRCYAAYREAEDPVPPGREPLPICRDVWRRADLEPVFERELPNRGDLGFELYPAGGPLRVGLYRVSRPRR
ncbi:MAG: hypothetical protein H6744_08190 [Deltaproteobacteria bacterium]|nr:hypothetical protein [Deltaproteobacteria bacterium]